jgi:hypothetical protein
MMTLKRISMDFYDYMCKTISHSDYVGVLKTASRFDDLLGKFTGLSILGSEAHRLKSRENQTQSSRVLCQLSHMGYA